MRLKDPGECNKCDQKDSCKFREVSDAIHNGTPISGLDAITLSIYEEFIDLLNQKRK